MFNQPLYDAKKNTLKLGIELINIRSKAMNEVLALIKNELIEIGKKIEKNELDLKKENLSKSDKHEIADKLRNNLNQEIKMKSLRDYWIQPEIKFMIKSKERILSISNSNDLASLYITDPFSDSYDDQFFNQNKNLLTTFFSSNTFKQVKETETAFETAELNEQNMLSFRRNTAGALMAVTLLASLAIIIVSALALAITTNPIAGSVIAIVLTAAAVMYFFNRFDDLYMSLAEHLTTIDGTIVLGDSGESLFPELDRLVPCENDDLGDFQIT